MLHYERATFGAVCTAIVHIEAKNKQKTKASEIKGKCYGSGYFLTDKH